jgi:predicted TIM-barrel fold metal-dependent hydrolase
MKQINLKTIVFSAVILAATVSGASNAQDGPQAAPHRARADAETRQAFSPDELRSFCALEPIDTHTHVFQSAPAFYAMLHRLHMHIVDICVVDDHAKFQKTLLPQLDAAWEVVHASGGQAALCTTFDPFGFRQPGFAEAAIRQINQDFDRGAVAVKIWKNIGMELLDAKGQYVLPDNPIFAPIYKDIAAHHTTLIAHVADPNTLWQPPNRAAPDYSYYMEHPEWYMYGKAHPASKEAILRARDHLLEQNPDLRVVGAHLGSMEGDFDEIARHLDRYPNFAVDLAARMPYVMKQPRDQIIAFITRYQDRLVYATDLGLAPDANPAAAVKEWEETYARDWRFFATTGMVETESHQKVQGLGLPDAVLRKLYHDNAVSWFPGVLGSAGEAR